MSYPTWPGFIIDTGSEETHLTLLSEAIVKQDGSSVKIVLKGLPTFDTEMERTQFLKRFRYDPITLGTNKFQSYVIQDVQLTIVQDGATGKTSVAKVQLPEARLSALPNNILGLDAISKLGKLHVISDHEAFFDVHPSAIIH